MFERVIVSVEGGAGDADTVALSQLLVAPEGTVIPAENAEGRPVPAALHHATVEHEADLIVVCCSEHGVLGGIRARHQVVATLRCAPCAVAVAPQGFAAAPRAVTRVGVGYDGGPHAQVALDAATTIAARMGARVHALAVAAPPHAIVSPIGISAVAALEAERDRTEQSIARLAPGIVGRAVDGIPHQRLAEFSADVDLLVIGSSGRSAIGRVLLGSTSEVLSHEARCPLLVVPAPASSRSASTRPDQPASAPVA